jgi:acetylglutamate kinase
VTARPAPKTPKASQASVVIKIGGNALATGAMLDEIAEDIKDLRSQGWQVVVVFGGGPQIDAALEERGISSTFLRGLRVTTPDMVDVISEVALGSTAPTIVAALDACHVQAEVAHQPDGLLGGRRRVVIDNGEVVDWGMVGEIAHVDVSALQAMLDDGVVPVVPSLAIDEHCRWLNVNADTTAGSIASELGADRFLLLTDVEGLYERWPDRSSLVSLIDTATLSFVLPTLAAGMVPKMDACLRAVEAGVRAAQVVDGRAPRCVARAMAEEEGFGTKVVSHGESKDYGPLAGVDVVDLRATGAHAGTG